jgi:transposase
LECDILNINRIQRETVMSKQTIYIGVDVGKDELWAVVEGKRPRKFSHSATGIRALHRWVYRNNQSPNLHFCLEATGVYSQHLAVRLDQYKDATVSIVNPAQIAAYAKAQLRRTKTDQVDARVILSFAQTQQPPIWSPPTHELEQLYTLRSHADAIEAELQQWNNRIHAHSFRSKNLTKSVRTSCNKIQRVLKRELARIEQAMEELIATSDRLADNRDLLCSIPGIAEHSATKILAYGRDQFTIRNRKQLTAHAGLAPREQTSGSSVRGKTRIAKQGDRRLRTALFMPTLVGIRFNPILKEYYQRLVNKGKLKKVALVACMRKLLMMIQAILISRKTFNPNINTLT